MVHRSPEVLGNDGAPVTQAAKIVGDVRVPRFGWDAAAFDAAARAHDLCIHCAAAVRFDLPEAEHMAINVGGTANAIAFARAGGMPLLHVSTAYVCGKRDGPIGEDDPLPRDGFANGYEASKAAAEALVEASGIPFIIARPSIVVGDSMRGTIRVFDTIYAMLRLLALGHLRVLPARAGATLDLVPIDHVAGGIVDLAGRFAHAAGRRVHLVAGQPTPIVDFINAIARQPAWHTPELIDVAEFDPARLPPRERRLHLRVAAQYRSYFARSPRFEVRALAELTGRICPATDGQFLARLASYCVRKGFLPGPGAQRMSG